MIFKWGMIAKSLFSMIAELIACPPHKTQVYRMEGLKWLQCPVCRETIYWQVPAEALKEVKRFPAPVIIKHKDHYLVCYVDSHLQLADTEIAIAFIEGASKE
jgi:hypothetical protein